MVLARGNHQEVFVMLVVIDVVFDLTGSFSLHCFSMSSLTLLWAMAGVFTPLFILSAQPSQSDSRHFHFNFSRLFIFTASATVLSECFLPTGIFLPNTSSFVTQVRAGTPHPGSSSVPAFTEFSLPYLNKYSSKLKSSHPVCLLKGSQA